MHQRAAESVILLPEMITYPFSAFHDVVIRIRWISLVSVYESF